MMGYHDQNPERKRLHFGVIGAGAIGSLLAARLALAGCQVTVFARNPRLRTLVEAGITLEDAAGRQTAYPAVVEGVSPRACDVLFLAVKAQALPGLIDTIVANSHAETMILPLVNGVPWWYFAANDGLPGRVVRSVDPDARLTSAIDPRRVIGTQVFMRVALGPTGDVRSEGAESLVIGEICRQRIDGTQIDHIAQSLGEAGIAVTVSHDIRRDLWKKIALNLATNPLSVVSGASLEQMATDPRLRDIVVAILSETLDVARAVGCAPPVSVEALLALTAGAGQHKTSMAQDHAAGRPLELGAIAHAVFEIAESVGRATPVARAIAALAEFSSR